MSIPVFSFVAWSGTGKTTLLEKLVPALKERNLRVAVVKHDGHDFQMDRPGKDTYRLTQAGTDVTAIVSATHAAFLENRPISEEEAVARIRGVDVILTEGCQDGPWPKIGLARAATGRGLKPVNEPYALVLADAPVPAACPVLALDDLEGLANWIAAQI